MKVRRTLEDVHEEAVHFVLTEEGTREVRTCSTPVPLLQHISKELAAGNTSGFTIKRIEDGVW